MEAKKNIFGQYKRYVSPTLSDEDKVVIYAVLNSIADAIQEELTDDEFIQETSNEQATTLFLVSQVNKSLPDGITHVDGKSLKPLLRTVIKERLDIIANK